MNQRVEREPKRTSGSHAEMIGAVADLHRLRHAENALHEGDARR